MNRWPRETVPHDVAFIPKTLMVLKVVMRLKGQGVVNVCLPPPPTSLIGSFKVAAENPFRAAFFRDHHKSSAYFPKRP